jgi:iron complex transport system ATP-binding protein
MIGDETKPGRAAVLPPTIEAADLSVRLGRTQALDGVSCRLQLPGLVALVGPNGAGKSTLLRAIAGLVPPDRGRITIDGRALDHFTPAERATTLAYLPQDRLIAWPLSVRAVVGLGRAARRDVRAGETAADRVAVKAAMDALDVGHFADRSALDLSGGERARVLIARALAQDPRLLLADEPAAGLDPGHQWALFEHLSALSDRGMRVVVAVHELSLAARFAAEVVLLDRGRIVAAGATETVLTPALLARVYGVSSVTLDVPGGRMIIPTGRLAGPGSVTTS